MLHIEISQSASRHNESSAVYEFTDPKDTVKALSNTLHICIEKMPN